jgi:membrane protein required for colicin V production
MKLTTLDFIFLVLIGLGGIRGLFRGFVSEVLSVAAFVLGVAAAVLFSNSIVPYLVPYIGATAFTRVAAFLLIFIAVTIVVKIIEKILGTSSRFEPRGTR